ncbi:TPA: PcfJ domain-containing protein, partial [Mannheimia haemolytica]|nr:PcfJ domain-containing protein [Mannheimia haemolytica]HDL5415698.1 PcfJ domain-containing protein [Mannheimia haemolytica]
KADNIQELLVKFFSRKQPVMQNAFNHQKRIVKWLWAEFWDKNIISMTLRIDGYRNANLWHYLRYQSRIEVLYKIANEYPNLLPLLAYVKPEYWKCSDLFSYQNWVRSSDKQPFILYAKYQDKMLCESKGQWRWLKKQSRIVVDQCFLHVNQWQLLTEIQIPFKIPVCVICFILTNFSMISSELERSRQRRLLSIFIQYIYHYWKDNGFRQLKVHLSHLRVLFQDIEDYMIHEGYLHGIPQTWKHLVSHSEQWHQHILEEQRRDQHILEEQRRENDEAHQALLSTSWSSPIDICYINEIEFQPLTTGQMLFDEGQRMRHCIFTYIDICSEGRYLAFSVKIANESATLGLIKHRGNWKIEQFRYACNIAVCEPMILAAAQKLCKLLNKQSALPQN